MSQGRLRLMIEVRHGPRPGHAIIAPASVVMSPHSNFREALDSVGPRVETELVAAVKIYRGTEIACAKHGIVRGWINKRHHRD
jgi:hypothetical protein